MKKRYIIILSTTLLILLTALWGIRNIGKENPLYSTKNKKALEHYRLGVKYTLMYYTKEARKEFAAAIEEDPDFPLPYMYQIAISFGPKEKKIAQYYKKIAVPQKNWTEFEKEFTSIFMEFTKRGEKANKDARFAKKLEDFINKYADKIEIYPIILPMYQSVIGDKSKLLEYYSYLHEKFPNNTQILNRLGYLYLEQRDYKNAENCFKKYIFIEPGNANPYDSIADLYFALGDYKKAIRNYKKALNIKPDFYNSKIKLALCYTYIGKLKLAEKMLDEFTVLNSEVPYLTYSSYSLKAFIYSSGGEREKLKNLYLNFNPPDRFKCFKIPVTVSYATMFQDKKLLSEALKNSKHCYKFVRDIVEPFKIINLIWEGKKEEAEKIIKNLPERFSELTYDKKILYMRFLVRYYLQKGDYNKIQPFLNYLKEQDKAYFNLLISKSKKDRESCREFAKKVLEYYNESDDNFYIKKEALECLK